MPILINLVKFKQSQSKTIEYQHIRNISRGQKMSCLKGTSLVKKKDAKVVCGKCGARVKKKSQACKPIKIKAEANSGSKKK